MLVAAERAAVKNWGAVPDADGRLSLRARRRVRHMLAIRQDYADEAKAFVLALRMKDQAFEQILEPADEDRPPVAPEVDVLIRRMGTVAESEGRLVDLWATFQVERLALARDLSTLPYLDWKSFLAQFVPEVASAGPVPPAQAPPAPVAPPPGSNRAATKQ